MPGNAVAHGGGYAAGAPPAYGDGYGTGAGGAYGTAPGGAWAAGQPGEPGRRQDPAQGWAQEWGQGWGGQGQFRDGAAAGPLEEAFARGVGHGLRVLYEAPLNGRAAAPGAADEDILWLQVPPGGVRYGAPAAAGEGGSLLLDGGMWRGMIDRQHRLLRALDRWIEQVERAHEDRAAAGLRAGEAARTRADEALLASIDGGRPPQAGADATYAACRLVAEEARIALGPAAPAAGAADGTDPVERLALAARVRTRRVRLAGRWWRENSGPLVGWRLRATADGTDGTSGTDGTDRTSGTDGTGRTDGTDGTDGTAGTTEAAGAAEAVPVALLWRRGGYVALDPATGRRERVGARNAAALAPHAVMFYRPLPDRPLSLPRLLYFSLRGTRGELRRLVLGGLVSVGLGALVPLATGKVLGEYVPRGETGPLVRVGVALLAIGLVSAAYALLQNLAILRIEGRIEATLQPAVWDRLLRLPPPFFAGRSTGELAAAAMGISAIRRVLSGTGSVCVQAGAVGAVNLVLLLVYSVPLALVALAMLLAVAGLFAGLGLWQLRYQRRLVRLTNRLSNQAFQTLRGLPKLRVAAAESFAYAAWAGEFARTRALHQRIGRVKNTVTVLNAIYLPLSSLLMFLLLAGPAEGSMSVGGFLTFSTAVTMLLSSVTQLTGALLSAAAVQPMFEQVRPILREPPEVRSSSVAPGELRGRVEARNLSYRYAEDGPLVLDDVSIEAREGEFLAIVGPSGCGKSTLLRLLIGFDRPLSGSVLYDGQDLAALDQAAVRRQCGVVLQHAQPLTGSLLDCIRGAGTYALEEVWEAVAKAGLAEDVKAMPMGLHTVLSDGGGTLSGGQRQRLMIAQALIRRPRVLFLDEATSALDNEAQRVVIEATRGLRATRIVIAHRLSTVLDADRVVVLHDGRVAQQGPPAALLADTGGLFHELVRRQLR
ncbi:NHLP bacteriocin export ABC transporter permease/ATPase subunit [Streptomyces hoynatensis]|uniref:NHLP bacteriocin export ABC transporter permease/ATPase subunit n=2 Tax=Streptomyces hoynatensis TaxID=1141874 RepID=A0A3A9YU10_9ACTN|nr:NHLP bacteriocin export ABC transporter permease/ATPase subunit [Streptomyces hoynatensis]